MADLRIVCVTDEKICVNKKIMKNKTEKTKVRKGYGIQTLY